MRSSLKPSKFNRLIDPDVYETERSAQGLAKYREYRSQHGPVKTLMKNGQPVQEVTPVSKFKAPSK